MAEIRFTTTYPTERGVSVTIDILDTEFSGDATDFNTTPEGYQIKYSENGFEAPAQFMATEAEVGMYMENNTHFEIVADFATSQEGRFLVRITEDAQVVWIGKVLLDISAYEERDYPTLFKIKAVDGIGSLKDIPFKDGEDFYEGKAKIIQYVARALSHIPHTADFYGPGDIFIRTAIDWWEENMDHDPEGSCAWGQAYLSNAVYYKYGKDGQSTLSCYDVLKDIATTFAARITFKDGAFWVEQPAYRVASTIITRRYDIDGSFIGAANYNSPNSIDQTAAGALLSTGQYEYTAPLYEARHTFANLERRNLLQGAQNVDDGSPFVDTFKVPIHANSGKTTLRITGTLNVQISSNISEPGYAAPLDPFVGVFRINLTLATQSLQRTYTLQPSFQVAYSMAEWNPTPGCYIIQPFMGAFLANTTDDVYTFNQNIDIMTPPLPENTETWTWSVDLEDLKDFAGNPVTEADFNITFGFNNLWLEVYTDGGPTNYGDGTTFYTRNTDTGNTKVLETEGLIGSSTNVNTVGAIWVKPSTEYILAELWGVGDDTPAYSFVGQLQTMVVAATRAKPARKLNGSLYGDINALSRVEWDGVDWLLMGGTWNSANNTFTGEWMEMRYAEGLTPSAPIKFVAYPDPEAPGTNTDVPGSPGSFRIGAPLGTILYPVAVTLSGESIRANTAITTLEISHTLTTNDIQNGDKMAIVEPFSGAFEEFTVTADSTTGDTFITASFTPINSYPKGSPIVRISRIDSGFSMPGGVNGQILLRTGGKWKGYGTASIPDGYVLTWTDAGGWEAAAASGGLSDGDKGDITVSSSGTVWTIDNAVVTLAKMANMATASFLGRNTSGTGSPEVLSIATAKTMLGLSGTNSGDQTITLTGDVTGTGTGSFAATIANNAVTVAKMAQLAGLSILARASNSTGNVAALTASTPLTYLRLNSGGTALEWGTLPASPTVSGAAGQVAFFSTSTNIDGDVSLLYDQANGYLQINKTGTPVTATAHIEVRPASGANDNFLLYSANMQQVLSRIANARNTGSSGSNILELEVGGANAGDSFVRWIVSGGATWVIGIDNSDGDVLRILNQTTPSSGSVSGEGIRIETGVTTKVGINKTAAIEVLDVGGNVRGEMFKNVSTTGSIGTYALGTGAGAGASITSSFWWGNGGILNFTSGTSPAANSTVTTITMAAGYKFNTRAAVIVQGRNIAACLSGWGASYDNTTGIITIIFNGTLPASTALQINILSTGL
jgi:hypothetical protein